MPCGGHEGDDRAPPLEQRVGGDRRAVGQESGRTPPATSSTAAATARPGSSGVDGTLTDRAVGGDEVGEGPAGVDAHEHVRETVSSRFGEATRGVVRGIGWRLDSTTCSAMRIAVAVRRAVRRRRSGALRRARRARSSSTRTTTTTPRSTTGRGPAAAPSGSRRSLRGARHRARASWERITAAHRRLARAWHPDGADDASASSARN